MRKIQSCRNPVLQMLGQEKALTRNLSRLSRVSSNRRSLLLPGERCPASPDAFYTTNSARLANDLFGSVSGPKLPQEAGAEAPSAAQTDFFRFYSAAGSWTPFTSTHGVYLWSASVAAAACAISFDPCGPL